MLETSIKKLTEAVEANTAALLAQGKAAPAAGAPKAAPAQDAPAAEAPTDDAPAVTKKELGAAIIELVKAKNRKVATGLLGKFGAESVPKLKPEQYDEVYAAVQEQLKS